MKILFVCTGNTCRSSMAAGLARKILEERGLGGIQVASAGIAAFPGERATREAMAAAAEMGICLLDHRATPLTHDDIREASLVLTMTTVHREYIKELFPQHSEKIHTLAGYAGTTGDIPDPLGYPLDAYRECARRLEVLITRSAARLEPEYRVCKLNGRLEKE
ncbi:MAG: Low molecular weight protein-tyrosine-phosphatase YwlE [Firmicutes bacterium ADurb.Bin456]|nr:MAG: Low molecular weight protein-tyrosine-phosphatase YwlE [Firmicutes bacterium ADurb.Bin456]